MVQTGKAIRKFSRPGLKQAIKVGNRVLSLSNLEKQLYPSGFTKADIIHYYEKIQSAVLPHLKDRPFTLKRYPEGTEKSFFYEKNCPSPPEWITTIQVQRENKRKGGYVNYCTINEFASLVWMLNLAAFELHTLLSTVKDIHHATMIAFDMDPGEGTNIVDCCRVGLKLKKVLEELKLRSFAKTSGSKGLHIFIPLNGKDAFEQTKQFARTLALHLEQQEPEKITSNMSRALRKGKIFVDWSQNDEHKTTVTVYSLRAWEKPTVSTPVTWEEVEKCLKRRDPKALYFESEDVIRRVQKSGDLFKPVLTLKQKLPA